MTRKDISDVEKVAKDMIRSISSIDIDETYRPAVLAALLTKYLLTKHQVGAKATLEEGAPKDKGESLSTSLPSRILALRESGFFKQPRTDLEAHAEISKSYSCDRNRVSMALLRLSNKRELRRTEKEADGKQVRAYAW